MVTGRRKIAAATVMAALLFLSMVPGIFQTTAQTMTCTPSTCQEVYPGIPYAGVAPVQSNPQPPVFGGYMYIANTGSNTVSVIDNATNIANVTVGMSPGEPAYDSYNGQLYVPNAGDNTVSVISGTGVVATISVGPTPLTPAVDPANGYIYVPDSGGCSISFNAANCGNTVTVISNNTVVATIQVGLGPQTPAVNTDPSSAYFGFVYVPNAVADPSLGNGTLSVISPTTDSVALTFNLGFTPPPGAFFDPQNDLVYAGAYVIDGVTEIGELPGAGCTSTTCVMDASGNIYTPGGTTDFVISGTNLTSVYCPNCGNYATYDPVNGWIYMNWAMAGTTPFAFLGISTEASGLHDSNSFDPNTGHVYASCGGCYYSKGNGSGQHFGSVVFLLGNSCGSPGEGDYYNATYADLCSSGGKVVTSSQTLNIYNGTTGLPEAIGGHVWSLLLDSVFLGSGRWNATTPSNAVVTKSPGKISFLVTGPNGTTGFATLKIPKIFVSAVLLAQSEQLGGAKGSFAGVIPQLYVDGLPTKVYSWTADDTYFYVTFRVHFSQHVVTVYFSKLALQTGNSSTTQTSSSVQTSSSSSSTPSTASTSSSSSSSSGGGFALPVSYAWIAVLDIAIVALLTGALLARRRSSTGRRPS